MSEQPGESKTPLHRLLLPIGLLMLGVGLYWFYDFLHLEGPSADQLRELNLQAITNVVVESEVPGSQRIDSIWLTTSEGLKIRYRNRFPYSLEVLRLDPKFSLLLDVTNMIWGLKTTSGEIVARSYFEEYNIEAKSVGKVCGGFLSILGAVMIIAFFLAELGYQAGKSTAQTQIPVLRTRRLILIGILFGYLFLFGFVIAPWLGSRLPSWLIGLSWVVSGGLLGNSIVRYFKKNPPPQQPPSL